ncbi:M20/M25/M40 family metallo-hydrolase [Paenibacillus sp. MBLB4367]|uniref:M20/M25/M40 family metallo-hydrolase n=1 Tax=Paenibacillus sp. MBLB4367 TaxID=3384767 RepID=UPI0039081D87
MVPQADAIAERVKQWAGANRERIVRQVIDLIEFDTVNQVITGKEERCQHHLKGVLEALEMETDLYSPEEISGFREHPAYFPGKDYTDRPNVIGTRKGSGGGKSIIFSSHIDTTVVAPGWSRSPWEPWIDGDRLYGLGSFDMKGGLAASIMAVQCLSELGIRLRGDVMIESVVDEEFGGANGTLAGRIRGGHPDAAIVPEPTNLAVCPASKGGALWRITFRGTTGLAFSGETIVNPVYAASAFMSFLERFEQARCEQPGPAPWYENDRYLPVVITRVEAGDMTAPLCDSGPTVCHVDVWIECYPGTDEEQLKQELLQAFARDGGEKIVSGPYAPEFGKMIRFLPGSEIAPDFPLIGQLANEVERVTGEQATVQGAPFACDAFMFNLHSPTPAIILGPKGANAHAPDEYAEISSLLQLVEIYAMTMVNWCGTEE